MLSGAVLVTYLVTTVNFYLAVVLAAAAVALLAVGVERTVLAPDDRKTRVRDLDQSRWASTS